MARAMTVVFVMLDTKKIAPERLAAAGYSEHHPVATNDTGEGRSQNRRVDIVVIANPAAPPTEERAPTKPAEERPLVKPAEEHAQPAETKP
jgi:chemotaxis protein MotB